jgi:membrane protein involved in colicin uptake
VFTSGFQSGAFQYAGNYAGIAGGLTKQYSYHPSWQSDEYRREEIRKNKTELQKVESVINENERLKALAAQSEAIAREKKSKSAITRLEKLQQQYVEEINRLLMVRAALVKRIAEDESMLIIMIAMRRKRFRA